MTASPSLHAAGADRPSERPRVFGGQELFRDLPHASRCVSEHPNAATTERLKTGHCG